MWLLHTFLSGQTGDGTVDLLLINHKFLTSLWLIINFAPFLAVVYLLPLKPNPMMRSNAVARIWTAIASRWLSWREFEVRGSARAIRWLWFLPIQTLDGDYAYTTSPFPIINPFASKYLSLFCGCRLRFSSRIYTERVSMCVLKWPTNSMWLEMAAKPPQSDCNFSFKDLYLAQSVS